MVSSPPIRVGIVDYLNSKPLAWGFLTGGVGAPFEASFHSPARVADLLRTGDLEVGLIPSIELQRIPDLELLPGLCVASEREVRSVLLLSREPIARIRSVALDVSSRTSAALVQILFRERWGIAPELHSAEPDVEAMLRDHDAALIIGDPALRVDRGPYLIFDLARAWRDLTGLPFVFAVWAVRAGLDTEGLGENGLVSAFEKSLEAGLRDLDRIVAESSEELGVPKSAIETYLTRNLSYRLGGPELAGLEEFYRRARRLGLIEELLPLRVRER